MWLIEEGFAGRLRRRYGMGDTNLGVELASAVAATFALFPELSSRTD